MFQRLEEQWLPILMAPLAHFINRTGISPNALTILGFFLNVGVGYVLSLGYLQIGGILIILTTLFDILDGALARVSGRVSHFGAFLDSTLDRFAEGVIYLGLLLYYLEQDASLEIILVYLTIVGSLIVSYARSRAESIGVPLSQGLLRRSERMVILIIGLIANQLFWTLWLLAIFSNVTAVQRIWLVWRKIR